MVTESNFIQISDLNLFADNNFWTKNALLLGGMCDFWTNSAGSLKSRRILHLGITWKIGYQQLERLDKRCINGKL